MPTVYLTIEPWKAVTVTDAEYLALQRQGLIYTGGVVLPPAAYTNEMYDEADNPAGEIVARLIASGALGAGSGGGVDPEDVGFDIVIAIGQSNMSKSGQPLLVDTYDTPDPRIWQWAASGTYAGSIVKAVDPLLYPAADLGTWVAPPMGFAREWVKRVPVNRQVLIVPAALGGTGLVGSVWAVGGSAYLQAISLSNAAIAAAGANARVVAFLWIQGEAESVANVTGAAYIAAFDPMIAGFRANVTGAASTPFVVGSMVPAWRNAPNGSSLSIHAAHVGTPSRVANSFFVDGPTGMTDAAGNIHYSAAGMREIGKRMALALWATPAAPAVPSQVTGLVATPGDTQIVLTWGSVTATPALSDFVVQYKTSASGTWLTFTDGVGTTLGATVTGLANGTSYDFRVAAVNSIGQGAYSTTAVATPTSVTLPSPLFLVDARTLGLSDGAALTTWSDTSTNPSGPDPTQASSGAKPTYRATGLNGHPSVEFDGGDSLAISASGSAVEDGSGAYTVVAVFSATNFSTIRGIIAHRDDSQGAFHLVVLTDGTISFSTLNGDVSNASAPAISAGVAKLVVGTRDTSGAKVYVNGVHGTDGATAPSTIIPAGFPFTVGRVSNALWNHLGHISYLAIYPGVLTSGQRNAITSTLMADFSIV